jgi:hypothetical protein
MNAQLLERAIAGISDPDYPAAFDAPLRASFAGACARRVGYQLRNEPATNPLTHTAILAFNIGSAVHLVVQAALQRLYPDGEAEAEGGLIMGDNGEGPIPWDPADGFAPVISCHADFFYVGPEDIGTVVEIKSMQPYAFNKAKEEGVQEHHLLQVGLAGLALGAEYLELVYVNKSQGQIAVYRFHPSAWRAKATQEAIRLARVYELHTEGELAPPMDPERKVWQCKFCPWLNVCEKDGDHPAVDLMTKLEASLARAKEASLARAKTAKHA